MPETTSHAPLHMVQLHLETRALMREAARLGPPGRSREHDLGYELHGFLAHLFGESVLKPFWARPEGASPRTLEVLGYTRTSEEALRDHAAAFAEPQRASALRSLHIKTLPREWQAQRRLGFEIKVCPVVRNARGGKRKKGAEVDAFLAACDKQPPGSSESLSREGIYIEWLRTRFDGVATLDLVQLKRFRRIHVLRRTQGSERRSRFFERPEATFRGELTITDGRRFGDLLARGVGRHRAFGFGMLLLRPPGSG